MEKAMKIPKARVKSLCAERLTISARCMRWTLLTAAIAASPITAASSNNVEEVTLKPGASETCTMVPCTVYLVMPPGSGSYAVMANGVKAGDYPAGETVNVGEYWAGATVFEIQGGDFSPAKLWVIGEDD
jgi:hypothetical protein